MLKMFIYDAKTLVLNKIHHKMFKTWNRLSILMFIVIHHIVHLLNSVVCNLTCHMFTEYCYIFVVMQFWE